MKASAVSQTLTAPTLEYLDGEADVVEIYLFGNLIIFVWLNGATQTSVAKLEAVGKHVIEMGLPVVGMVHWLTPDRPMPDPSTRTQVVQACRDAYPPIAYSALVLNGDGFWASAIRATLNGMRLLVPRKIDMRLDCSIDDTAAWLPEVHRARTGSRIPSETLRRVVLEAVARSS